MFVLIAYLISILSCIAGVALIASPFIQPSNVQMGSMWCLLIVGQFISNLIFELEKIDLKEEIGAYLIAIALIGGLILFAHGMVGLDSPEKYLASVGIQAIASGFAGIVLKYAV